MRRALPRRLTCTCASLNDFCRSCENLPISCAKSSEVISTLFRRPKFKSLAALINVCNQRRDSPLDIVWSPFQHLIECSRHHRQQDEIAAFTEIVSTGAFHKFVSVAPVANRITATESPTKKACNRPIADINQQTVGRSHCGMVSAKSLRAAAAKASMLASRSALPVSTVIARSIVPATARQVWPAGSP